MDKIIQPANPVVGVAASSVATCDLMIGPRYHAIWLELTATAAAGVTLVLADVLGLINVKINGKVQRAHKAIELNQIQTAFGSQYAAQIYNWDGGVYTWTNGLRAGAAAAKATKFFVPIFLAEPWRKSYAAQEARAWYTAWEDGTVLRSLQLEIEVLCAAAKVTAGTFSVNVFCETDNMIGPVDKVTKQPIALISKWNRLVVPYGGAGDLYITNLPRRDVMEQVSLFNQADDDITRAIVKKDGAIIRDVYRGQNDVVLFGRDLPVAGASEDRMDVIFDYADLPTDGLNLNGARDLTLIATLAAANAASKLITVQSLTYGGID